MLGSKFGDLGRKTRVPVTPFDTFCTQLNSQGDRAPKFLRFWVNRTVNSEHAKSSTCAGCEIEASGQAATPGEVSGYRVQRKFHIPITGTYQDLVSATLIFPEISVTDVYSRHSRLRDLYGDPLWHETRLANQNGP